MLDQLIEVERRFQPYLKQGDFTFIGPANFKDINNFIAATSQYSKGHVLGNNVLLVLSDKAAVAQAIRNHGGNDPLRIYVVDKLSTRLNQVAPMTLEDYVERNNIKLPDVGQ